MMKAAIFDLDGTIIDSNPLDYEAWSRILQENGANLSWDEYLRIVGATSAEIFKQYLQLEDKEKIDDLVKRREAYFREVVTEKGLQWVPGAEDLLKTLQTIPLKLALATGANQEKLDFIFKRVNIRSYFEGLIAADEVTNGKPDPEVFLKAAAKLGVEPGECIVFEDAQKGVEAAKAGGMQCIAINTNGRKDYIAAADLVIDQYAQLDVSQWLGLAGKGKS